MSTSARASGLSVRTARAISMAASRSQVEALSSPVLVSILDWASELRVHHEPPGQQHRGHRENRQDGADRDDHGDQDAEVELGEVT